MKYIDIKEFREKGFLQEANRLFFHPFGLALEIIQDDDGVERLGGIWDYRDDPEGMIFDDLSKDINKEKADYIHKLAEDKGTYRTVHYGWRVQPIGNKQV
jgi:hypothetical protein